MRGSWLASLAVAGILGASVAVAQQDAVKIGFVDVERAIAMIDEGKNQARGLEEWARPRQEELAMLGKEINDLQGEIQSTRGVASEEQTADLNRKLISAQRAFEDRQRVSKRDFEEKQEQILKELGGKLQEVIATWAAANKFTVVFILKGNDVAYLAASADVTDTIITLYNEKHPIKAPAAAK